MQKALGFAVCRGDPGSFTVLLFQSDFICRAIFFMPPAQFSPMAIARSYGLPLDTEEFLPVRCKESSKSCQK
jgi:hypothetical protein